MVGRCISFWDGLFSGAFFGVSGRVPYVFFSCSFLKKKQVLPTNPIIPAAGHMERIPKQSDLGSPRCAIVSPQRSHAVASRGGKTKGALFPQIGVSIFPMAQSMEQVKVFLIKKMWIWLVVSTPLKNISPQIEVKIKKYLKPPPRDGLRSYFQIFPRRIHIHWSWFSNSTSKSLLLPCDLRIALGFLTWVILASHQVSRSQTKKTDSSKHMALVKSGFMKPSNTQVAFQIVPSGNGKNTTLSNPSIYPRSHSRDHEGQSHFGRGICD